MILALGITWILDGLEVTLVGSISARLTDKSALHFSTSQATAAGSFYLACAVGGVTALAWGFWSFVMGKSLELVARPLNAVRRGAARRRPTPRRRALGRSSSWSATGRRLCAPTLAKPGSGEERQQHRNERQQSADQQECLKHRREPLRRSGRAQ